MAVAQGLQHGRAAELLPGHARVVVLAGAAGVHQGLQLHEPGDRELAALRQRDHGHRQLAILRAVHHEELAEHLLVEVDPGHQGPPPARQRRDARQHRRQKRSGGLRRLRRPALLSLAARHRESVPREGRVESAELHARVASQSSGAAQGS